MQRRLESLLERLLLAECADYRKFHNSIVAPLTSRRPEIVLSLISHSEMFKTGNALPSISSIDPLPRGH